MSTQKPKFRWQQVSAGAFADGQRRFEGTRIASSSVCAVILLKPDGSCTWQIWGRCTADGDARNMVAARVAVYETWLWLDAANRTESLVAGDGEWA